MPNLGRPIFVAASTCCLLVLCVDVNGLSVGSATVPVATATIKNTELDKGLSAPPSTSALTPPRGPPEPKSVPLSTPSSSPTTTNTSASTPKPASSSTSAPSTPTATTPTPSTTSTASTKAPPKWAKWAAKASKKSEEDSNSVSSSESDEEDFDQDENNDDGGTTTTGVGAKSNTAAAEESYEEKIVLGKEKDFRTAALEFINYYRSTHGVPALVIDPVLNTQAQSWATNLADTNTLDYSCTPDLTPVTTALKIKPFNKCKYSEGIALVEGNDNLSTAARAAIQQWYREGLKYSYKYGAPTPTATTGKNVLDFTAMLWKGSKKVGFGLATDKNGEIVFVANYSPAGNVAGQYGKNVLP